jgi:trans-aconitate 2-methyltransferase
MDWDARTYDCVADPMTRWGAAVVERLALEGDERVLDAGCGSGRVTQLLLEHEPGIRVVALDVSASMLGEARRRLSRYADRVVFMKADLSQPLPLDEPVDAVMSTATLHWVRDHDALFANLAAVMRPGAPLAAQFGAAGNIGNVISALRSHGHDSMPWTFATREETEARLRQAGFGAIQVWLHPEPTRLQPGEPLETYLSTVVLRAHLAHEPEDRRATLVKAVAARIPDGVIDYVRIDIAAHRL